MASNGDQKPKQLVLITGSNQGIGYEMVKKLSAEHHDTHHVLLCSRNITKGQGAHKSLGSPANVTPVQLDITDDASVNALYELVDSKYGKLDVLTYQGVYDVNVISPALMTEKFTPLLSKVMVPKLIWISSQIGSIGSLQDGYAFFPAPWYGSSKAAMNYHAAYYARKYPQWRSHAVCPGFNATNMSGAPMTEETHPSNGAIRVSELIMENVASYTGTFSNKEGSLKW
ncbi:hypothetical protein B9Z65_7831 [Elsinoe australis]|uniref:Uncharacterized protein n=1 Tax=Elsinoe australis TaxID=40998 RepID=A0A2P8A0Q3_9PEZI|nr:hypothetical protein B9Z65_7831 [Elsinoe australis]